MSSFYTKTIFALLLCYYVDNVYNHGMMLNPVNRASLWRVDHSAPPDYDDDGANCGGLTAQQTNEGRCGICGDNYKDPRPRAHELGGKYGIGKIVAKYNQGDVIDVFIDVTANHKGWFQFSICNLDEQKYKKVNKFIDRYEKDLVLQKLAQMNEDTSDVLTSDLFDNTNFELNNLLESSEEVSNEDDVYNLESFPETESCFKNITLADGSDLYHLPRFVPGNFTMQVKLPDDLVCQHCVFRWHYRGANNWGICPDGHGEDGCGPQEHFMNCADISIQ